MSIAAITFILRQTPSSISRPTPLTTWFYAMYLMSATRCGISAKQIERETGVTYKTAWRMFKQIRSMLSPEKSGPIGGWNRRVEMDETFYGGKGKGIAVARCLRLSAKTTVVGMVQRKGEVRAFVAADTKADTLLGLIREHVLPQSLVFTDEWKSYNGLDRAAISIAESITAKTSMWSARLIPIQLRDFGRS